MTGVPAPTLYHRWLGWHAPAIRRALPVLIAGLIGAGRRLERLRAHLSPDHLVDHHPGRQLTRAAARRPRRPDRRLRPGAAGRGQRGQPPRRALRPSPRGTEERNAADAADLRRRADRLPARAAVL